MLCIAGMPSVVLCAKRAANAGHEVRVATSCAPEDDAIERVVTDAGIAVVRGSLDDVLARFILATQDMADDDFLVRLTADNMLPDGHLVRDMFSHTPTANLEHFGMTECFPYGLGATACRVRCLREADAKSTTGYDREHVTPWVMRHYPVRELRHPYFERQGDLSHIRCTIDSLSDYERVRRLMETDVDAPCETPWWQFVDRMVAASDTPKDGVRRRFVHGREVPALQLGTAQLGMKYGIANEDGLPDEQTVKRIFDMALQHGANALDTARDYGLAEARIGALIPAGDQSRFHVVTKLSALTELEDDASADVVRSAVDASIFRSCRELRRQCLPVVLLHRASHVKKWGGAVLQRLLTLQSEGAVTELGLSIYNPEELELLIERPQFRHVQLPFHVLDRRWRTPKVEALLGNFIDRNQGFVTVRSVLLQGLFTLPPDKWPERHQPFAQHALPALHRLVQKFERENIVDLCIAYARAQTWVHSLVMGAENIVQLQQNLRYAKTPPLQAQQVDELEATVPPGELSLVQPFRWNEVLVS